MNVREITEFLNEIESDLPVQGWKAEGFDVWPLVKTMIYFELYNSYALPGYQAQKSQFTKIFSYVRDAARYALYSIVNARNIRHSISPCDVLFMDDPSYIRESGKYFQRFCDPVIADMKARNLSSGLLSLSDEYHYNRHTPAKFFGLSARFHVMIERTFCQKPELFLSGFDEVMGRVESKLPVQGLRVRIMRNIRALIALERYFTRILKQARPRAVFLVSYYNVYGMALIAACHGLSIPCADLQHGTQNQYHVGYGRWKGVPVQGYNTLPSCFACWDAASVAVINDWANDRHRAFNFGNPYMEHVKSDQNPTRGAFGEVVKKYNIKSRRNVLLTLQPCFGLPPLFDELLQNHQDIFWWVRFHPMMKGERAEVSRILRSKNLWNVEFKECSDYPLYAVLPFMNAHVTLNSSVVHEASDFGVPSVVCDETAREYYGDFLGSGRAVFADTTETVYRACVRAENFSVESQQGARNDLYDYLALPRGDV